MMRQCDKRMGKGYELKYRWLPLNVRWVTEHRHRLPRETVEFPSLDILGKALFMGLGKWL